MIKNFRIKINSRYIVSLFTEIIVFIIFKIRKNNVIFTVEVYGSRLHDRGYDL